ncbi:MAG: hypothetical protein R3F53_20920 [Gammaproteobacteria bacterium]
MSTIVFFNFQRWCGLLTGLFLLMFLGVASSVEQPDEPQADTSPKAVQASAERVPKSVELQSDQASVDTESNDLELSLKERVESRWQALIRRDFDGAYEFNTPSYRALYSKEQFGRNFGNAINWDAAKVQEVSFKEDEKDKESDADSDSISVAKVAVLLEYSLMIAGLPQKASTTVHEDWLLRDGVWWYVPDF